MKARIIKILQRLGILPAPIKSVRLVEPLSPPPPPPKFCGICHQAIPEGHDFKVVREMLGSSSLVCSKASCRSAVAWKLWTKT